MRDLVSIVVVLWVLFDITTAQEEPLQFANSGECVLESREVIRDCKIGYRTFGRLNPERTNAVLVPTWFTGTTTDLAALIGPGKLFDTSAHYFVAVDSLGNGVSASPSKHAAADVVSARVHSRHGEQSVSSPDERARSSAPPQRRRYLDGWDAGVRVARSLPGINGFWRAIVGSPRLAAYDLLNWQTRIDAIRNDPVWNGGNYREQPARRARAAFGQLLATTPARFNATTRREEVLGILDRAADGPTFDANDYIRQAEAMMALDVSQPFGGDMAKAAASVKAELLVIVSAFDHVVTPGPAIEFAKFHGSPVVTLQSECGHLAFSCESDSLAETIRRFLSR